MSIVNKGKLITQGKTKWIYEIEGEPSLVLIESGDDITKHDDPAQTKQMKQKAVFSTATTSAVFELLRAVGLPVAFKKRCYDIGFIADRCQMIPLEVIIRRYADGSCLERSPHLRRPDGSPPHRFHRLVCEFNLKTTGGKVQAYDGEILAELPDDVRVNPPEPPRPVDDPLIVDYHSTTWDLVHPHLPSWDERSVFDIQVPRSRALPEGVSVAEIEKIARQVFLVLEGAWAQLDLRLIDFKIEFGINQEGKLVVADVIESDSWRLRTLDWKRLSKQLFRDGSSMEKVASAYALVAKLVERFAIPKQVIVFWRGSSKDKFPDEMPIVPGVEWEYVTLSGHKAPSTCLMKLENILTRFPGGGVIIVVVGKSNGLGPTLASRTSWPVIAVPATAEVRPHDVWSSLECPSQVPLGTVLDPKNAVLMALNVLAQKNPAVYMHRRYAIELLDGNVAPV